MNLATIQFRDRLTESFYRQQLRTTIPQNRTIHGESRSQPTRHLQSTRNMTGLVHIESKRAPTRTLTFSSLEKEVAAIRGQNRVD